MHVLHSVKKSVQIISIKGEIMGKGKRGKKRKIKKGVRRKKYYTEELKKLPKDKLEALKHQKYYTAGSIVLMFAVLASMYFLLY